MKKLVFTALIAVLLCMVGCSETNLVNDPTMSESATLTMNDRSDIDAVLEKFPSGDWLETKYYLDGDIYSYSEVECAYYYHDGQKDIIDVDDPRLTLLLNLLLKSSEDMTTTIQHSYIWMAEILQCYKSNSPMIEVVFKKPYQDNVRGLLICKDSYLSLLDTETGPYPFVKDRELLAERKWPFESLLIKAISEGTIQSQYLSSCAWGGKAWFDILDYCGFYE